MGPNNIRLEYYSKTFHSNRNSQWDVLLCVDNNLTKQLHIWKEINHNTVHVLFLWKDWKKRFDKFNDFIVCCYKNNLTILYAERPGALFLSKPSKLRCSAGLEIEVHRKQSSEGIHGLQPAWVRCRIPETLQDFRCNPAVAAVISECLQIITALYLIN